MQAVARGERVAGELDQCLQVQRSGGRSGISVGLEFQGSHGAGAEVAEALHRIEGLGAASLAGEPLVDQQVAEFIGQGIRQQAGQAFEGFPRQVGEAKSDPRRSGSIDGRNLDPAARGSPASYSKIPSSRSGSQITAPMVVS